MNRLNTSLLAAGVLAAAIGSAHAQANSTAATNCSALERTDFSGIQDAPTQVMEARVVEEAGDVPAYCHVQGYIWPQVGIELQLPTSEWNGKFIEIGCGGLCGTTRTKGKLIRGWCDESLRRGYACIVSNQGHQSTNEGDSVNTFRDGLWAYNNLQAQIDYGFRATHVAALAGKAITQHYYSAALKYSYFFGCSGGGRQAMVAAQRFPWDFDGIIAMDSGVNIWGGRVAKLWNALVTRDAQGRPLFTPADIDVLNKAAVAQCDANDGLEDGVIDDPRTCQVDTAKLRCKNGQKVGCLSQAQVEAARKVYNGPVTSEGKRLCDGILPGACPPMPGAEGPLSFGEDPWYAANFVRYMGFMPPPGPGWKASDFNFDVDYKRFGMVQAIFSDNNPDLRRFKAAGGKLIITQGWHDSGTYIPLNIIDYYETMEKTMGGRAATQEFARLFMMPGRGHCGLGVGAPPGLGGPGANAVDYLGYLEAWVEQGRAPDMMIAAHIKEEKIDWSDEASAGTYSDAYMRDWSDYIRTPKDLSRVKFTRPIYPYPLKARYTGRGDPNDYRSFKPVEP